jgi:hypothetical protein
MGLISMVNDKFRTKPAPTGVVSDLACGNAARMTFNLACGNAARMTFNLACGNAARMTFDL